MGGGEVYRYLSFSGGIFDDIGSKIVAEEMMKRFGKQGLIDSLNETIRKLNNK